MNKDNSNKLQNIVAAILSYLAIISFVLVILHDRSPVWKMLVEQYLGFSMFRFILVTACAATLGGLYLKRSVVMHLVRTDVFRYGLLLVIAGGGLYFNFHALELLILLYAVYAFMFASQSLEGIRIYKVTRKLTDHFLIGLFDVESRTPAVCALFLLLCIPIFLISKKAAVAENIAIYVYYFLIITVVLKILQMKLAIEKENHLLALLRTAWQELSRTINDKDRREKYNVTVFRFWPKLFTKSNAIYFIVLIVILAGLIKVKTNYWRHIEQTMDSSAEHRSKITLLDKSGRNYTFPAYTDELNVPIRVEHPASRPLWWPNTGGKAVVIGIQWFLENRANGKKEKLYEDFQRLPRPLFVNESDDIQLILKRPPIFVPAGQTYEVRIGLVSEGRFWYLDKEDSILKLRVNAEAVSTEKSLAHEARLYGSLVRGLEDRWSYQLSSTVNSYHSKIEVLKNDLFSINKMLLTVTNTGKIPWPVHGPNPVCLGVVWLKKTEKDDGIVRTIHLGEKKFSLSEVVLPGDKATLQITFDPFKVPHADEIWIGMVDEGNTWFYKRGDPVFKVDLLLMQPTVILREKNMRLSEELRKIRIPEHIGELTKDDSVRYRSKIQLLNHADVPIKSGPNGLVLDLEITNMGKVPWKPDQPANENPVNLGILWFNKSKGEIDQSMRKAEERCVFPFTVLEDVTLRMECKIGGKVQPGNYEVWIGPVHENVSWFYEKGDQVLKLDLTVP